MKIAIIEDDLPIAAMYKHKLTSADHEVKVAHDGELGFNLLEEFNPELVLLDLKMPKITGDEMLLRVRETEWGSKLRVIILTNLSKDEAPTSLRFLNIDRYVVKAHHTPAQVLEIVNEVLGIKPKNKAQYPR